MAGTLVRALFLALWVLAVNLSAAPIQPPAAEDAAEEPERVRPPEIRAAIEQFEQGDAAGAFEKLKTAVVDYPHLPPARVMLANLFFSSGNLAAGRASLEQAAIETPDDPETYLIFGDLLVRERRWTEADAVYAKGEELWTKFAGDAGRKQSLEARLVSGRGAVSEARGQWEEAAKLLERWAKLAPNSSAAQQRLGRAYFMLKREKDAFAAFEAAAALSPNGPPAAISMAMLHQKQGDAAKGEKWIRYALERDPKKLSTQLGAAQWNWQSGRLDAAAKHAAEALALDSESLDAQLLAAQAAYYQRQSDVARPLLEKLHEKSPGNFVVTNLLAWSLAASDDAAQQKRAVELAGLNSERFPDSAEAAATLGWALHRVGNSKEAAASLQRIRANASLSRDAAYYVARVLHAAGETAQAEELLQSALKNAGLFAAEDEARAWQATLTSAPTNGS